MRQKSVTHPQNFPLRQLYIAHDLLSTLVFLIHTELFMRFSLSRLQPNLQLNRNVWYVLFTSAVVGFAVEGGIYSVLFNIYLLRLDYGTDFIGVVNSVGHFSYAIAALLAGAAGQRWGVRRIMLVGIVLATLAGLLIPLAQSLHLTGQSLLLTIIVAMKNTGNVFLLVGSTPYIMAYTTGNSRNTAFALDSAFYGIAAFVGAWLGGLLPGWIATSLGTTLDDPNPYRYSFLVVILILLAGIYFIWKTEPVQSTKVKRKAALAFSIRTIPRQLRTTVGLFTAISILGGVGMSVPYTFGTVYFDDQLQMPTSLIGSLQVMSSLIGVVAVLLLPQLLKRWSLFQTTLTTYFCIGVAIMLIGATSSWQIAGGGFVVVMASYGLRFTAYRIYTMEPIPEAYQSMVSGILNAGVGVGFAVMAFASGFLIEEIGYRQLFFFGGGMILVTALLFWFYELSSGRTPQVEMI